jgi:glyoxylase-like metal-dependent hydrolase (beta-lactamase superfamily II)
MAQSEYLYCRILRTERGEGSPAEQTPFYTSAGLEPARIAEVLGRGQNYLLQTTGLPSGFERLGAGQDLAFGGRDWRVLTGGGHSPEQVMLAGQGLFFAADQVLARISPNISVVPMMPNDDPLSVYLDSLAVLAKTVPDDVLVLPCHNLPFRGLHARLASLAAHHRQRCDVISLAAKAKALTAAEILTAMFPRPLDPHQYRFAIGETLAHVNHMLGCGRLVAEGDAVRRYRSA